MKFTRSGDGLQSPPESALLLPGYKKIVLTIVFYNRTTFVVKKIVVKKMWSKKQFCELAISYTYASTWLFKHQR